MVTLVFCDWRTPCFAGPRREHSDRDCAGGPRQAGAGSARSARPAAGDVFRDGSSRSVPAAEVVEGGPRRSRRATSWLPTESSAARSNLRLDESILTGESESVPRGAGDQLRSGAYVVEGSGTYLVTAVGGARYAGRLVGEARSHSHPRSPLEQAVNCLLLSLVALVVLLGSALGYSLWHRQSLCTRRS
ncbi:MAG: hypothetical protein ACRDPA_26125 [Solirubrobacteraceae bacterium]